MISSIISKLVPTLNRTSQLFFRSTSNNVLQQPLLLVLQQPLFRLQPTCSLGTKVMFKTNKSAAKRMRVRGSGGIKRNKGGAAHNTGYKTRARCNRLGTSCGIQEPAIEKRMRRLIGK